MMTINDGGPAYPASRYEKHNQMQSDGVFRMVSVKVDHAGMTLRDWFAGQALAAMLANPNCETNDNWSYRTGSLTSDAYRYADIMLAERQKEIQDDA